MPAGQPARRAARRTVRFGHSIGAGRRRRLADGRAAGAGTGRPVRGCARHRHRVAAGGGRPDAGPDLCGTAARGALLLVHDDRLLRVMDEWLAAIPVDTFTEVLPLLRRTFGAFARPERRAIGERARDLTAGGSAVRAAEDIDVARAEAVLPVIARLL